MSQHNDIIGTLLARLVGSLLHHLISLLCMQVVQLVPLIVKERVSLSIHRLRRADTHESHALTAILPDDIRCHQRFCALIVIEVHADSRRIQPWQQFLQARHTKVVLMVTQRHGIIAHAVHQRHDILTLP